MFESDEAYMQFMESFKLFKMSVFTDPFKFHWVCFGVGLLNSFNKLVFFPPLKIKRQSESCSHSSSNNLKESKTLSLCNQMSVSAKLYGSNIFPGCTQIG